MINKENLNKKKINGEYKKIVINKKPIKKMVSLTFALPTYNREKTIGMALQVLCEQISNSIYKDNISILISENHSKDGSLAIANKFKEDYDFIKIISPSKHLPTGEHNLFYAIKNINSDFIWSFADDDLLLPGAIDHIYEKINECENNNIDFILINSKYQDSNGRVISREIINLEKDIYVYKSFSDLLCDVGPTTILASFSSSIFRAANVKRLNLEEYLIECPIYAHVFSYLSAYVKSKVAIIRFPLVVLRKTTTFQHWEKTAERQGWYTLYPWTGGLTRHILKARDQKELKIDDIGFSLNSNELGRYGTVHNIMVQFLIQLVKGVNEGLEKEIPSSEDFMLIRKLLESQPYASIDSINLLAWGEKYFYEFSILCAPKQSELSFKKSKLRNLLLNKISQTDLDEFIKTSKQHFDDTIAKIKDYYVSMGNFTASNKPYILFQDNLRTITRIGSKYYSINNFIFNTDWMQIKPEIIGAHQKSTEWDIFESFENAFESLKNNTLSNVGYENNPLLNYLTDKKWAELKLAFIKEGVEGILKVAKKIEWINKSIENLCNYSKDNFELKDDGLNFIDINWYIDKYAENSHGDLRKLLNSNPLLHYLLVGSKAGMSPSPFLDENFYRSKLLNNIQDKILCSLTDYLASDLKSNTMPYFDIQYYIDQCKTNNLIIDCVPIIHFLNIGKEAGLCPHPDWNEKFYLEKNPDVKLSSRSYNMYGWVHYIIHGRFENRISSF